MSGRARNSHARGHEFKSRRCFQAFYQAGVTPPVIEHSLLQYLEACGETGGFAIYCKPRHKGSLILSPDSVGDVLEVRSHNVLDSTS